MKKRQWSLNRTEVRLLQLLQGGRLTLSELASEVSRSMSHVSESVTHLETLGMVEKQRQGTKVCVNIPKTPLGASLSLLMTERPMLNLETLFSGSGLVMLPLLLKPGYTAKELAERTSLSLRTVRGLLPRWKRMGVVVQEKTNNRLNPRFKLLADFLRKFNEHRNLRIMKDKYPEAVIVWQWRDEFMFSVDRRLDDPDALPAGLTRLDELKSSLAHTQQYYYFGHADVTISEEEAFMQALYVDPYNPRIKGLIGGRLLELDSEALYEYAGKYAQKAAIKELVKK
jgi:DNA-binding MarR family transcriptional regulator